jgi:hypothetical protein
VWAVQAAPRGGRSGRDVRRAKRPRLTEAERIVVALATHDPYVEAHSWCAFCGNGAGEKHGAECLHLRAVAYVARLGKGRA